MNQEDKNEIEKLDQDAGGWLACLSSFELPEGIKKNAITALAKGIGNIVTSTLDIPVAYLDGVGQDIRSRAKARELIIGAASESVAKKFKNDPELAERALSNFGVRIIEQQLNRESTAKLTLKELENIVVNKVEVESIDTDWLSIFWDVAEKKSNADIQEIFAKLLTCEIKTPGSVSPYTVQILSVLTGDLAKSFEKLCNISIFDGESTYVVHPNVFAFQNVGPLDQYSVSTDDLFDLDGANLIRSAETIKSNYAKNPESSFEWVDFAGEKAKIKLDGLQVNLIQFTKAGSELRNLISLERNQIYQSDLAKLLKNNLDLSIT